MNLESKKDIYFKYKNNGNESIISLIPKCNQILDVGCGTGDNARLILKNYPCVEIYGITHSSDEIEHAKIWMKNCFLLNLDDHLEVHSKLKNHLFDVIIFSHVLEHLKNPDELLLVLDKYLKKGGNVLIALPNTAFYKLRIHFLSGKFDYQDTGMLDKTHLRFYTFNSIEKHLLFSVSKLWKIKIKYATGSIPLWFLRTLLGKKISRKMDKIGCRLFPNIFGSQIIVKMQKL